MSLSQLAKTLMVCNLLFIQQLDPEYGQKSGASS
jgi:hypothetical protein